MPVGRVGKPHGIRGEVTVVPMSDYPDRFSAGRAFATTADPLRALEVLGSRVHAGKLIVAFAGITTRDAAEALRGATLTIAAADRRELAADEVWPDEMHGMVVFDPGRKKLGVVTGMVLGEHQDRLVVTTTDGRSVEVPFVDPIVAEIHPSGGFVVVDPPPGLF